MKQSDAVSLVRDHERGSRLFVTDRVSGAQFLIDTGADISVVPATAGDRRNGPTDYKLFAANDTEINTYGERLLSLDLGLRRMLRFPFIVADVRKPIIGADFLRAFRLLVDITGRRLVDEETSLTTPTAIRRVSVPRVLTVSSNFLFRDLIAQFPSITNPSFTMTERRHTVTHHIITQGPPVTARARRLPPDRLLVAKNEFQRMVEMGICRPSKSDWSSPLQLVRKKSGDWRPCGDYR